MHTFNPRCGLKLPVINKSTYQIPIQNLCRFNSPTLQNSRFQWRFDRSYTIFPLFLVFPHKNAQNVEIYRTLSHHRQRHIPPQCGQRLCALSHSNISSLMVELRLQCQMDRFHVKYIISFRKIRRAVVNHELNEDLAISVFLTRLDW